MGWASLRFAQGQALARPRLRDFQKLNSSSCGMGIPARPGLMAGRMPNAAVLQRGEPPQQTSAPPQENFEDFFIWKSLRAGRMPNAAVLQRGEPPQQTSAPPQENFDDLFICESLTQG